MMKESSCRILVTGASRGIGAATVRRFSEKGNLVAFTYKNSKEQAMRLAEESGAVPICADSSSELEVKAAVSEAERALGDAPDVLVINAGISKTGLLTDMTYEEWQELFDVNVGGAFLYAREVIPAMVRRRRGRIIVISSIWGMVGASCEVAYSATKAALLGFTKALAKELGPSGITVNAVAPGVIDTEMLASYGEDDRAALREETPLLRLGTPDDVASAILFLASDDAGFITGQVLSPNGGFTVV